MKQILYIVTFLIIVNSYAQEKQEKEQRLLQNIENAASDSLKVSALLEYSKHHLRGDIRKVRTTLNKVKILFERILTYDYGKHEIIYHIQSGYLNRNEGDFSGALRNYFFALELAEKREDTRIFGSLYHNIAGVFRLQKEYHKAIEYLRKSIAITENWNDKESLAISLRTLSMNFKYVGEHDSAWYYNEKARNIFETIGDSIGIINTKMTEAQLQMADEQYHEAVPLLLEVVAFRELKNELYPLTLIYNELAEAYSYIGKHDSALFYLDKSLPLSDSLGTKTRLSSAYRIRSKLYASINEPQKSLDDLKKHFELYKEIYDLEKVGEIKSMELSFEFEKERLQDSIQNANEKSLLEAEMKARKASRIRNYVILGMLFLFLITLYLFNRKRLQLEQAEKELLSLELVASAKKIETKEKTISNLIVESIQQIRSKKKLKENLKKVNSDSSSEINLKSIIADLNADNIEDNKLLIIREQLKSQNFDFHNKLKSKHPDLSQTDLEICSFIKLGLDRNDISKLRNTSVEAVKKSRYRIRKKMNLGYEIDLKSYLLSFEML